MNARMPTTQKIFRFEYLIRRTGKWNSSRRKSISTWEDLDSFDLE